MPQSKWKKGCHCKKTHFVTLRLLCSIKLNNDYVALLRQWPVFCTLSKLIWKYTASPARLPIGQMFSPYTILANLTGKDLWRRTRASGLKMPCVDSMPRIRKIMGTITDRKLSFCHLSSPYYFPIVHCPWSTCSRWIKSYTKLWISLRGARNVRQPSLVCQRSATWL